MYNRYDSGPRRDLMNEVKQYEAHSDHPEALPEPERPDRRLRRVPGFLPERLQNELHGGKPVLPEEVNALDAAKARGKRRGFSALFTCGNLPRRYPLCCIVFGRWA